MYISGCTFLKVLRYLCLKLSGLIQLQNCVLLTFFLLSKGPVARPPCSPKYAPAWARQFLSAFFTLLSKRNLLCFLKLKLYFTSICCATCCMSNSQQVEQQLRKKSKPTTNAQYHIAYTAYCTTGCSTIGVSQ